MSRTSEPPVSASPDKSTCLARSVIDVLGKEPSLEAVTVDRSANKISVATLGKTDEPRMNESITGRIQKAYEQGAIEHCSLLEGSGDCHRCSAPLSEIERKQITIEHKGDVTTIARVTCTTAPKN